MEPEPRDLLWEEICIRELEKEGRKAGVSTASLQISSAMRKLAVGQERYGNSFRNRDILTAAREKAHDLIAYTLLEAQKRNQAGTDGHHYLFKAAVYAMMAEEYLRLSKRYE